MAKGEHVKRTSATALRSGVDVAETSLEKPSVNQDEDPHYQLAKAWKKIQGEDDWKDLLEHPIDPVFRRELLKYGDFVQICYDSFDFDSHSIYCGSCKYHRTKLLKRMGKDDCGYEVTKYLYATTSVEIPKFFRKSERGKEVRWSGDSNWIGYVAVATDKEVQRLGRRDVMVAWRGTVTGVEWIEDLRNRQTVAGLEKRFPDVKVEDGFLDLYTSSKPNSRFNKQCEGAGAGGGEEATEEVRRGGGESDHNGSQSRGGAIGTECVRYSGDVGGGEWQRRRGGWGWRSWAAGDDNCVVVRRS